MTLILALLRLIAVLRVRVETMMFSSRTDVSAPPRALRTTRTRLPIRGARAPPVPTRFARPTQCGQSLAGSR